MEEFTLSVNEEAELVAHEGFEFHTDKVDDGRVTPETREGRYAAFLSSLDEWEATGVLPPEAKAKVLEQAQRKAEKEAKDKG